jgi:AcrR family transcriptional regulator
MLRVVKPASLREQHADLTRERILAAVAELLERGEAGELTVPAVADASGVSLRTVYRHYPTREALLEAAARWIGEQFFAHRYPRDLDEVADLYQDGCRDFDRRPGLVRAMALSQLGREVRAYRRRERVQAIRELLKRLLKSGEFQHRALSLPRYRTASGIRPPDTAEYARWLLGEARVLEIAGEQERASAWWRKRAEYVARELEHLAAWIGADT